MGPSSASRPRPTQGTLPLRPVRQNQARKVTAIDAPSLAARRLMFAALGLTLAIIVANGVAGDRGLIQTVRLRRERQELAAAISRIHAENRQLSREAARLRDDPSAIEELARGELGLIRRGERLFILSDRPVPGP